MMRRIILPTLIAVLVGTGVACTHEGEKMSLVDAACKMMSDGDSQHDAVRALKLMSGVTDSQAELAGALAATKLRANGHC